jgi:hypothetical protein
MRLPLLAASAVLATVGTLTAGVLRVVPGASPWAQAAHESAAVSAAPSAQASSSARSTTTTFGGAAAATPSPSTGSARTAHDTVGGIVPPILNTQGQPTVIPPSLPTPVWPQIAQPQRTFVSNIPGTALTGVLHYVGTGSPGVVLPAGPGEPHILCAGPTNPLAAYALDTSNGQYVVYRYDGGTNMDFYYRFVHGYYQPTSRCS